MHVGRLDRRDGRGGGVHEKRLRRRRTVRSLVRERLDAARFYPATDYIKALRVRTLLMDDMAEVLTHCDVMAVPGRGCRRGWSRRRSRRRT